MAFNAMDDHLYVKAEIHDICLTEMKQFFYDLPNQNQPEENCSDTDCPEQKRAILAVPHNGAPISHQYYFRTPKYQAQQYGDDYVLPPPEPNDGEIERKPEMVHSSSAISNRNSLEVSPEKVAPVAAVSEYRITGSYRKKNRHYYKEGEEVDTISCHRCNATMRACVRKMYYQGSLKEYPTYRCTRKGCQTFKSPKTIQRSNQKSSIRRTPPMRKTKKKMHDGNGENNEKPYNDDESETQTHDAENGTELCHDGTMEPLCHRRMSGTGECQDGTMEELCHTTLSTPIPPFSPILWNNPDVGRLSGWSDRSPFGWSLSPSDTEALRQLSTAAKTLMVVQSVRTKSEVEYNEGFPEDHLLQVYDSPELSPVSLDWPVNTVDRELAVDLSSDGFMLDDAMIDEKLYGCGMDGNREDFLYLSPYVDNSFHR